MLAAALSLGACGVRASESANGEAPPHLVLQGLPVLTINTQSLASKDTADDTLYEISGGQLHITPPDKARYLYGAVREAEPNRLIAEHFTILVSADTLSVTLVQSNETTIKVTKAKVLSH